MSRILALCILAILTAPVMALEDRTTGLKVELTEDFTVEAIPRIAMFEAVIGVNLASGETFGGNAKNLCEVTFDKQPGWVAFDQKRFNDKLGATDYPLVFARQVSSVFKVLRSERFELRGIVGHEFIMALNDNPTLISVNNVMETPEGKTAVTCIASSQDLERALPVFREVLSGVTPPLAKFPR